MKVDTDLFQNQVTFVEPVQIMMVDIIEDVNSRHIRTLIAEENANKDLD